MSETVLDASALIAYYRREPGVAIVAEALPLSAISSVNLTEVITRLIDVGYLPSHAEEVIEEISVDVIPYDAELAVQAALLREQTRHAGLSLGDRACLALARRMGLPALTADRRWAGLDVGVDIRLIRD